MLTAKGCLTRRRILQERLPDHDLCIISSPAHIFYFSGFLTPLTDLASEGLSFLLIDRAGHTCLIAGNTARQAAQSAFVDQVEIWTSHDHAQPAPETHAAAVQQLSVTLKKQYPRLKTVAIEQTHLPVAASQPLETAHTIDLSPMLYRMRRHKYEDEIACIRHAIRATEAGHTAARHVIRPGITELDVYTAVQAAIILAAGEPIVMRGAFVAGQRSEAIGGPPTENILKAGDLMILDLYPIIGGYRADLTNTLCVGPSTRAQQEHIFALHVALQAVETVLRPGTTGGQIYAVCYAALEKAGLAEAFPHHAGHGLGLNHSEPPYLVPNSREVLQIGDVIAIEPGAYISGWGGARIEHNYLVTEDGYLRLSNHQIVLEQTGDVTCEN